MPLFSVLFRKVKERNFISGRCRLRVIYSLRVEGRAGRSKGAAHKRGQDVFHPPCLISFEKET